jgi:hypothetical protein
LGVKRGAFGNGLLPSAAAHSAIFTQNEHPARPFNTRIKSEIFHPSTLYPFFHPYKNKILR